MIRYFIKNNLKLMLRNKWLMGAIIVLAISLIAILSSAFQELMKSYESVDEFRAGYRLETEMMQDSIEIIKDAGKETGILFEEYPEGDVKALIENNDLAGFVEIGQDSYTVYKSEDYTVEGMTLEYFMEQAMKEAGNQVLQQMVPVIKEEEVTLAVEKLDFMPAIDAKDYYGIIYIVYFSWCGIVCATGLLASERKNRIELKYQVSAIYGLKLYFGKWISIVIVNVIEIGAAAFISIGLFDIHWGNPGMSVLLIALTIMGSTAFGLLLYELSQNLAIAISVMFVSVFAMGFVGGSYDIYMFSPLSDTIKNASPIYHVNRALVEYSCMGQSTYANSSILYMIVITFVCFLLAMMVGRIRKRGRA